VIAINDTGRVIEFNPAAEQIFGYTRDEACGQPLSELIVPPELRAAHLAGLRRHLETGESRILDRRIELTACDRAGRIFPIELTVTRIEGPESAVFTAHVRDISKRKAAERAMYESREQFANIARTLQQSLLPPHLPEIPGLDLAACYLPASSGPDVGGDFYDVFERARGDWILVVGDVCGKGAQAAAVTALTRYTIRAAAMQHSRPRAMLAMLNAALLRDADARSCTAVIARVRSTKSGTRLSVACGGHPLPRLLRSNGDMEVIGTPGTLLGVVDEPALFDDARDLHAGDALTLYTDGVTDARRGRDLFGEDRLDALLRQHRNERGARFLVDTIEQELRRYTDDHFTDDIAILVAHLRT
jgi:sigma-B regulation protein RsbU (phosphoserine phosphatase)